MIESKNYSRGLCPMSEEIIREGDLEFHFTDWSSIYKFDDLKDYKNVADTIQNVKGVDFLGVYNKNIFFIEVKDFHKDEYMKKEEEVKNRLAKEAKELMTEVGQKVFCSLGCILAGVRNSSTIDWKEIVDRISNQDRKVTIVLWLETPDSIDLTKSVLKQRYKSKLDVYIKTFKTKVSWLTKSVNISNRFTDHSYLNINVKLYQR